MPNQGTTRDETMRRCGWPLGMSEALAVTCALARGHAGDHRSIFEVRASLQWGKQPEPEPEIKVEQVPAIPIHPSVIAKAQEMRAELERLLTPEALAQYDAAERESTLRAIEGTDSACSATRSA